MSDTLRSEAFCHKESYETYLCSFMNNLYFVFKGIFFHEILGIISLFNINKNSIIISFFCFYSTAHGVMIIKFIFRIIITLKSHTHYNIFKVLEFYKKVKFLERMNSI